VQSVEADALGGSTPPEHVRTTTPFESTFPIVGLRAKGHLRRRFASGHPGGDVQKLIESAQERQRAVNALHLVALVRAEAGARFERGTLDERDLAA
jgi:hypothetical protein